MRARLGALAALASVVLWPVAITLGAVHLTVRPAVGSQRTHFAVSFIAQRTGYVPSRLGGYRVVASGPASRGCASAAEVKVSPTSQNQHVRVILRPGGTSHAWCRGEYAGRLEETFRPTCGLREMCPLARASDPAFVRVLTVGRFSFRIR
jgi:hypothetical protein